MSYSISGKEFESVSALAPMKRFQHFVKRVADWEEVWSLKNDDGWILLATSQGQEVVPLWPHPDYAQTFATEQWADCVPAAIGLTTFLEQWISGITRDGRWISVFATPSSSGIVLEAEAFRRAINAHIEADHGGDA